MRCVHDYSRARIAQTADEVRWVLGLLYDLYGAIECEIHVRGAYPGCAEGLRVTSFWAACILDEELEALLQSAPFRSVFVVPLRNIPSS